MDRRVLVDLLWERTWWTYHRRGQVDWVEVPYHGFNLVEGTTWVVVALLVVRRGRTRAEVAYAVTWLVFGATDFVEAYALTSWLLWFKGGLLVGLLLQRRAIIHRLYPASRLY